MHEKFIVAVQNNELIAAAVRDEDVMRVVSLLNSGADIHTKDWVCYILTTKKFTFSISDGFHAVYSTN